MQSHHVADMRDVGLFGLYFSNNFQCLIQSKMGDVLRLAQSIDDKYFGTFYLFQFFVGNEIRIRDVGKSPKRNPNTSKK